MKYILLSLVSLAAVSAGAQAPLTLPQESQKATVSQRIGITDITVVYHSPGVKGRTIWGDVVPYDRLWRAGANENTTVSFTHPVTINNQKLAAGTYGLHMIPGKEQWTIIFSNNATSWGSFFYKKEEDALRVTVKPRETGFAEWLSYSFPDKTDSTTSLSLNWEKIAVDIPIQVNVKQIVLANIKNELRSTPGFTWQGWYDAADFCYHNKFNYTEALRWINIADRSEPDKFHVLKLKSDLLAANGKQSAADSAMQKALSVATEANINFYGYQLMNAGKTKEAITVFEKNVKRFPKSWNAYDSLAEALAKDGQKDAAIKHYELALKMADADNKTRIEGILKGLKG